MKALPKNFTVSRKETFSKKLQVNVIKFLFFMMILTGQQSIASTLVDCSDKKISDSVIKLQDVLSHSQTQSLDFKTYDYIDFVMDCDYEFNESIAHEILHLLETRYKRFIHALHNAKGGYKDRLKLAQTVVPAFGVTKCTRDSWEEFCDEHGPINEDETLQIVQKTKAPQDTGMNAGRYYAYELDESSGQLYCEGEIKENNGRKYCVNFNLESLYTFVRGGEEYISVLLEKGINDPIQFEKIASAEEKKLFSLLKEYIF